MIKYKYLVTIFVLVIFAVFVHGQGPVSGSGGGSSGGGGGGGTVPCGVPTYNAAGITTVAWGTSTTPCFDVTISGGNTTFSFTGSTQFLGTLTLIDDSSSRTLIWPANAYGFPTVTPGASQQLIGTVTFDGTNYNASFSCPTCSYGVQPTIALSSAVTPPSGFITSYADSTANSLASKDSSGNQYLMYTPHDCTAGNAIQSLGLNGVVGCAASAATSVGFYSPLATTGSSGALTTGSANVLYCAGFVALTSISFGKMSIDVTTLDAGNAYDFGIYAYSGGALKANFGTTTMATIVGTTGTARTGAVAQGTVVIPAGQYLACFTGSATTAKIGGVSSNYPTFYGFANTTISSSGGAMPAGPISPPSATPTNVGTFPLLILSN